MLPDTIPTNPDIAIYANRVDKRYQVYEKPMDRLYQALWRGRKRFYSEFRALDDISFEIRRHETVGIIGSNGSGKSTLLRMVCGILGPTSGTLTINGRVTALLELGAGFNPEFTGRENVFLNAAIMGLSDKQAHQRFDEIADFADIGRFMDQPVKTYSNGMYVRLAFAVAVHVSPDILLIDEALSVGDIRFQQKCMQKIKSFCRAGTVLFVSHSMASVTELCSRVIWIENGRLRMDGEPKEVVNQYTQYMYGTNQDDSRWDGPEGTEAVQPENPAVLDGFADLPDQAEVFGNRRATIDRIRLRCGNEDGAVAHSGRPFEIGLMVTAHEPVAEPVAGFIVKDRMGREVFGDNTELMTLPMQQLDRRGRYLFFFRLPSWPNLIAGQYTLSLAIAERHADSHTPCHWYQDVAVIESIPQRPPAGIFSVLETDFDMLCLASPRDNDPRPSRI